MTPMQKKNAAIGFHNGRQVLERRLDKKQPTEEQERKEKKENYDGIIGLNMAASCPPNGG